MKSRHSFQTKAANPVVNLGLTVCRRAPFLAFITHRSTANCQEFHKGNTNVTLTTYSHMYLESEADVANLLEKEATDATMGESL